MTLARSDIEAILAMISFPLFPTWRLVLGYSDGRPYLQVTDPVGRCAVTGAPLAWSGRKWPLCAKMTKSEVVWTAFKACQVAVEHELRESFLYRGVAIAGPHLDVDQLAAIAAARVLENQNQDRRDCAAGGKDDDEGEESRVRPRRTMMLSQNNPRKKVAESNAASASVARSGDAD